MSGKCVETGPNPNEPEELDFLKLVPPWAWILGAGVAGIVALSFLASMVIENRAGLRLLCALAQFSLGAIAASIAHFSAYLTAAVNSDRITPFDFIMKPVDIWKPAAKTLPKVAWRFWALGWGVTASVCALLVIGGVRYSAIFDWGFEKSAESNLVHAIVDEARRERDGGAESLEDAMNDFVGEEEEQVVEQILPTIDCLIFAYTNTAEGKLNTILLATLVDRKLKDVATVYAVDISLEDRENLASRLHKLERGRSFVKTKRKAIWLKPVLMCRVAYKEWTRAKKLREPHFRAILADVEMGKSKPSK